MKTLFFLALIMGKPNSEFRGTWLGWFDTPEECTQAIMQADEMVKQRLAAVKERDRIQVILKCIPVAVQAGTAPQQKSI